MAWDAEPMLAEPSGPFSGAGWLFEIKYDGFRMLAGRHRGRPRLRYRRGADATGAFPEVAAALAPLPVRDLVLDGEIVVLDRDGRPNFQRLQQRFQSRRREAVRAAAEHPATLFLFDVLVVEERDVRALPLLDRKAILRDLVPAGPVLRYVDHVLGAGESFLEEARALGLEGIVGKRAASPYVAGRSRDWRKVRIDHEADFVVVGFTRAGLGEDGGLHVARYRDGALVYAGRVGTGFRTGVLAEARTLLEPLRRTAPPCGGATPRGGNHTWVEARVVCGVRYKEMTADGLLRQPVFVRFQPDRLASDR
jgi:bifunctional non-homologous end joining protein LigD